jgi:hypothetical protein
MLVIDPVTAITHNFAGIQNVLIIDDNGDYTPLGLSRLICCNARRITVVTSEAAIGRKLLSTNELPWLYPRVIAAGIEIVCSTFVERLESGKALLVDKWTGKQRELAVDAVILCMGRRSRAWLYHSLKESGVKALCIGDSLSPREVDDAIREGFREALRVH